MPSRSRGVLITIVIAVVLIAITYLIFKYVPLSTLRDLAIIVVAILNIVLLALLTAIAFGVWRLMSLVRNQLPPVIESAKRTATTIEGTADFATTTATLPLIRATSLVYATTRFIQVLVGRGGGRGEGRA